MAEIINTNYLSIGFPVKNWDELIERENFIDSIDSKLTSENKIVYLNGDEGVGKTTLLGQFCRRKSKNILSIFFNPYHSIDLDVNFLRSNLHDQIEFHLGKDVLNNARDTFITNEKYRLAWFNLKKKYRNSKEKIYLVIDGLESRGVDEKVTLNKLLKEIPYGEDCLRIIISGSSKFFQSISNDLKYVKSEELSVIGFSRHQIDQFLGTEALEVIGERNDLIKATKGYPDRLEVLRRLINDNIGIEEISNTTNFKNWIDLDTSRIDLSDSLTSLILSLLALSGKRLSKLEISKISEKNIQEIDVKLKSIHVLEEFEEVIQFISIAYLKFYKTILMGKKRQVDDLLIRHYAASDTLTDKFELSKLYASQNKWDKIPRIINELFLEETIKDTGSIQKVNESIDLGFKSSQEMKKYSEAYKYSIQGSIVNELDNYLFWESEIQARIALNDFVGSIDLAERAVLKADRLRLLSLVARKQKEINNSVDEELTLLIKRLYETTNLAGIGDSIYDIVSNLIYSIPNLAIEILENTTGNTSESNINDWIVAKLSLAAINSGEKEDDLKESKLKALERLNNPSVRKIQQAIALMVGDYSSKRVLEEVSKLNDSNERLKLLRLWLKNNRNHNANLKEVIFATLDELVSSSSTSESVLETLNDISTQLGRIKLFADKEELVKRFKEFEPNIKQIGLSKDLYVYKLNMFQVQHTLQRDKAEGLLIAIIRDITKIEDSLIQIEAYSEVFYRLSLIRDFGLTQYYNKVYGRIKKGVGELLMESANHSKITENILVVIGKVNPIFAIEICQSINTSSARDKGRLNVLDSYLDNGIKRIKAGDLEMLVADVENLFSKEIAIQNILERFSNAKSLPKVVVKYILPFVSRTKTINHKTIKLNCALLAFKVISKNTFWSNRMREGQKKLLWNTWLEVESDWNKIDVGYNISSEVSQIDPVFAKEIFKKTTEIKNQSWLDSRSVAATYLKCLRLILKAYLALVKNKTDTSTDFEKIKSLIDRIPSENKKLLLWSELSIGSIINENYSIPKKIYDNHIIPLTSGIIDNDKGIYNALDCFVVIHYFNTDLALDYLNSIPDYYMESACVKIVDFYISKKSPFENYDGELSNFKITYDNLLKAVKVLNEINTDAILYYQIKEIVKVIKENSHLSAQQKSELRNRIEEIVDVKLPDKNNITHDGYKILAKIQLELLNRTGGSWDSFVQEVQLIPNISDRILVKGMLLEEITFSKNNGLKKQLVSEVFEELKLLSSHYEFVDRVTHLSKIMYELSRTKWQLLVNQAFDFSYDFNEGQEMYNYQRNILDTIYRIDENFAKTLVNKTSKSKLEVNKDLLNDYYETLELSKKIKNNQTLEDNQRSDARKIISAVHRAQGSLNSGKITTKKMADVAQYLEIGKTIGLSDSYPVYSYFLSNSANIRLAPGSNEQINESQRALFDNMLSSIKFVELLSQKRRIEHTVNSTVFIDRDFEENLMVKPNSREEAINYIRNWIVNEAEEFLIVTDPYFKKEDIEILKFVKELDSEVETYLLGCNEGSSSSLETEFEIEWKRISDQEPPNTKVIFCWIPENISRKLIHDRWILSKNGGLRLGTSYRSLGANKETEISVIKPNEAFNILEDTVKNYLENKERYSNGQKIKYKSFTI